MTAATVVIPTFDHGPTLYSSVATARSQTVQEIEIFIVGDGVPETARPVIDELCRQDDRIRFFANPKGPRCGESYRHVALQEASGEIVCYLCDDDLWFPDHVYTMRRLLADANFAHVLWVAIYPGDNIKLGGPVDLGLPYYRDYILRRANRIPLSFAAHTLDFYRRLPNGWRTTPKGVHTDHYMWRQMLAHAECRPVSSGEATVVNFGSRPRKAWTSAQRCRELESWRKRLSDEEWRRHFEKQVRQALLRQRVEEFMQQDAQMQALLRSPSWRIVSAVKNAPGMATLLGMARGLVSRSRRGRPMG